MARDYLVVCASSYSPTDYSPFASWAGLSPHPIFVGISNVSDLEQYRLFDPVVRPLPHMICDFNDPAMFDPRPRDDRDIDVLMVANWLRLKRHWLLFEALRRLPRDLRVTLVGRNASGRTEASMRREARAFGVRQELGILTNIPVTEVAELQSRAKVAPLLTDREGSCVSVTECLFADTPVVMMQDAHVGSRAHINAETGRIATRQDLWRHLGELIERPEMLRPRSWARQHIAADVTSARLNATLRDYCLGAGLPWTRDIAPMAIRYVPQYLHAEDAVRLAGATDRFEERYGIPFARFVPPPSRLTRQSSTAGA